LAGGSVPATNAIAAPDGTTTADEINFTTPPSSAGMSTSLPAGKITVSCWLRAKTGTANCRFDIYSTADGALYGPDLVLDTTWRRYTLTVTSTSANSTVYILSDSAATAANFYAWGYQAEPGPVATSYIPTTTAAVSRSAEIGNINWPITGNFSNAEGTVITDFSPSVARTSLAANKAVFGETYSYIYADLVSGLQTYDGTNGVSLLLGWSANDTLRAAVRFSTSANQLQLGVRNLSVINSTWQWSGVVAYDGNFTNTSGVLALVLDQTVPFTFRNIPIVYDKAFSTAEIEARYP